MTRRRWCPPQVEAVQFVQIVEALKRLLALPEVSPTFSGPLYCIFSILCDRPIPLDGVTRTAFRLFHTLFGPLSECLSKCHDLVHSGYFHGELTSQEAEEALRASGGRPGSFLIRLRRGAKQQMALAFVDSQHAFKHTIISINKHSYYLHSAGGIYKTIPAMLSAYSSKFFLPVKTDLLALYNPARDASLWPAPLVPVPPPPAVPALPPGSPLCDMSAGGTSSAAVSSTAGVREATHSPGLGVVVPQNYAAVFPGGLDAPDAVSPRAFPSEPPRSPHVVVPDAAAIRSPRVFTAADPARSPRPDSSPSPRTRALTMMPGEQQFHVQTSPLSTSGGLQALSTSGGFAALGSSGGLQGLSTSGGLQALANSGGLQGLSTSGGFAALGSSGGLQQQLSGSSGSFSPAQTAGMAAFAQSSPGLVPMPSLISAPAQPPPMLYSVCEPEDSFLQGQRPPDPALMVAPPPMPAPPPPPSMLDVPPPPLPPVAPQSAPEEPEPEAEAAAAAEVRVTAKGRSLADLDKIVEETIVLGNDRKTAPAHQRDESDVTRVLKEIDARPAEIHRPSESDTSDKYKLELEALKKRVSEVLVRRAEDPRLRYTDQTDTLQPRPQGEKQPRVPYSPPGAGAAPAPPPLPVLSPHTLTGVSPSAPPAPQLSVQFEPSKRTNDDLRIIIGKLKSNVTLTLRSPAANTTRKFKFKANKTVKEVIGKAVRKMSIPLAELPSLYHPADGIWLQPDRKLCTYFFVDDDVIEVAVKDQRSPRDLVSVKNSINGDIESITIDANTTALGLIRACSKRDKDPKAFTEAGVFIPCKGVFCEPRQKLSAYGIGSVFDAVEVRNSSSGSFVAPRSPRVVACVPPSPKPMPLPSSPASSSSSPGSAGTRPGARASISLSISEHPGSPHSPARPQASMLDTELRAALASPKLRKSVGQSSDGAAHPPSPLSAEDEELKKKLARRLETMGSTYHGTSASSATLRGPMPPPKPSSGLQRKNTRASLPPSPSPGVAGAGQPALLVRPSVNPNLPEPLPVSHISGESQPLEPPPARPVPSLPEGEGQAEAQGAQGVAALETRWNTELRGLGEWWSGLPGDVRRDADMQRQAAAKVKALFSQHPSDATKTLNELSELDSEALTSILSCVCYALTSTQPRPSL
eukprot:m51a1_g12467 hypothetical protein (1146) ;mRNA; f:113-4353